MKTSNRVFCILTVFLSLASLVFPQSPSGERAERGRLGATLVELTASLRATVTTGATAPLSKANSATASISDAATRRIQLLERLAPVDPELVARNALSASEIQALTAAGAPVEVREEVTGPVTVVVRDDISGGEST
ncbi:MAG: hypothetical protein KIT83_22530, partial [Bryobacterales bacterium]|nr:hypothetical protein [Bryobacterales bacterium]